MNGMQKIGMPGRMISSISVVLKMLLYAITSIGETMILKVHGLKVRNNHNRLAFILDGCRQLNEICTRSIETVRY